MSNRNWHTPPPPPPEQPWRVQLPRASNGERRTPLDTTQHPGHTALVMVAAAMGSGGIADAIDQQNSQGQRQLRGTGKVSIPSQTQDWGEIDTFAMLRAWGVELPEYDQRTGDKLFRPANLPPGWEIRVTEHHLWSALVDEHGRRRALIFYKAAFYDRDASITVSRRFIARAEFVELTDTSKTMEPVIRDGDVVIWRGPRTVVPRLDYATKDAVDLFAERQLDSIYPDHREFLKAWADATERPVPVPEA